MENNLKDCGEQDIRKSFQNEFKTRVNSLVDIVSFEIQQLSHLREVLKSNLENFKTYETREIGQSGISTYGNKVYDNLVVQEPLQSSLSYQGVLRENQRIVEESKQAHARNGELLVEVQKLKAQLKSNGTKKKVT